MRTWLRTRRQPGEAPAAPLEERSSGEDAVQTAQQTAAEAAPSGQPRVKTDRL
jgi:hypothetical protein